MQLCLKPDMCIICTASNTKILHLDLTLEPAFPVEGDNSTFECTVDLTSNITGGVFVWKHRGYLLKEGRRVHEIHWSKGLQHHSRLQIFKSNWTDSGEVVNTFLYLSTMAEAEIPKLLHTAANITLPDPNVKIRLTIIGLCFSGPTAWSRKANKYHIINTII